MRGTELHRPQAVVLDSDQSHDRQGVFVAQPFERGWGVTVGNALRRILLSSIEGAAIVAVRFAGVSHEYDSIPGVMEDVTDLILNLKRVPLVLHDREETTVTLTASGAGTVTAGAIRGGAEIEVIDKDLYIATLSEEGSIDAELVIRRGRGYVPADEHQARDLGWVSSTWTRRSPGAACELPDRAGARRAGDRLREADPRGVDERGGDPSSAVSEAGTLLSEHLPIFMALTGEHTPSRTRPRTQTSTWRWRSSTSAAGSSTWCATRASRRCATSLRTGKRTCGRSPASAPRPSQRCSRSWRRWD